MPVHLFRMSKHKILLVLLLPAACLLTACNQTASSMPLSDPEMSTVAINADTSTSSLPPMGSDQTQAMITQSPLPTPSPSNAPTASPTAEPTATPTATPTASPTLVPTPTPQPVHSPQHLGIFYGWPSAARSDIEPELSPEQLFERFDTIVLGAGLAEPSHQDHDFTAALIQAQADSDREIFGYMDMGITTRPMSSDLDSLLSEIEQWQQMGITGIFWDDVGFEFAGDLDFVAYRRRVNQLIEETHARDLKVFINAWNPDDLLMPYQQGDSLIARPDFTEDDILLAEGWFVSDARYMHPTVWQQKAERISAYRQEAPFRLACLATGLEPIDPATNDSFQAAYWGAVMYGCDLFQYTNPQYGSQATSLARLWPFTMKRNWGDEGKIRRM